MKRTSPIPILWMLLVVWNSVASAGPTEQQVSTDPFRWLEDVDSKRALDWVNAHNALTMATLTATPEYQALHTNIERALESQTRIAYTQIIGDRLYNFWRDSLHVHGLWRRATWQSYLSGAPVWETVLDLDSLALVEGISWSFVGADCLEPENRFCLLELSRPNSDSTEVRGVDVRTKTFVTIGPGFPDPPSRTARVDRNELPYAAAAQVRIARHTRPLIPDWRISKRELTDADVYVVRDQVVVWVHEPWNVGGTQWNPGSLIATTIGDFLTVKRNFRLVMKAGPRETIESVSATRDYLLLSMLNNVCGELRRYQHEGTEWNFQSIRVPPMGSVEVISTSTNSNRFFFSYTSFLQPTTLYLAADDGSVNEVRHLTSTFDARNLIVDQMEATSKDGTKVPFFIVHRDPLRRDGFNPALVYAYGGFELSSTPGYGTAIGPAWIERGGVYVVANIRGGGEFGPEWHRAGVRENRQRVFDDFTAVAEELIRQRITSPAHLGIIGASNGGLLMGVAFTERPDLYNGVVVQSALLDMQRYSHLLGGAKWISEYGDPDKPEDWAYLSKYSPYQNLKPNTSYPTVMFSTSTYDDRVHPGHVRKMAAKMESMGMPFYYFESAEAGHTGGATNEQKALRLALVYTYLWHQLSDDHFR